MSCALGERVFWLRSLAMVGQWLLQNLVGRQLDSNGDHSVLSVAACPNGLDTRGN